MDASKNTDPLYYFGHEGQFGCFSNRCECYPFEIEGKKYICVDGYFQGLKFHPDDKRMEEIRLSNSKKAAKLGRSKDVPIRADWETVKEEVMKKGLDAKFSQNPKIGALLISTDGREIRFGQERSSKKDPFWGYDNGKGENKIGKILSEIRDKLKKEAIKNKVDINSLLAEDAKTKTANLHKVEYARTGQASCKVCEKKIEKKELRIGKRVIIKKSESYIWFHHDCYFTKFSAHTVEDWDGFNELNDKDKDRVRSKVTDAPPDAEKTTNTLKAKEYTNECSVEYASSGRASCKWCKESIKRDTLRIAVMVKTWKFDGKIPHWHHANCFFEKVEIPDLDCMDGLKSIRWEDQQLISTKFGKPLSSTTTTTTTTTSSTPPSTPTKSKSKKKDSTPTKDSPKKSPKRKRDDDDEEEEEEEDEDENEEMEEDGEETMPADLQQLTAKYWKLKDELKENSSSQDFKAILEENNQDSSGGFATLLERCADGMFYGAIPPCPSCKKGILEKLKYGVYKCNGWISDWTRCSFKKEASEVERLNEWKIPEDLKEDNDFFENFVFIKHDSSLVFSGKKKKKEKKEKKTPSSPKKRKTESSVKKVVVKGQSGLHPDSGLSDNYHIYKDKSNPPVPLNVTLLMSDISTGSNSYYIIQLAERDDGKDKSLSPYVVFKKWGRVGTGIFLPSFYFQIYLMVGEIGSSSKVKSATLTTAIKNFEKTYSEKSGNDWSKRNDFQKKPGKYYPVEIDYGNEEALEDLKLKKGVSSKLSKPLQELIALMFDVDLMAKTLVELEFDAEKTPLGMLGKGQIDKGYKILTEIQNLISSKEAGDSDKFRDLNNQFFTIIPHMFKRKESAGMMINTEKMVKDKVEMLDALSQIQVAYSLLKTDSGATDPLEANYKKLNTELEAIDTDSDEFDAIEDYIQKTSDTTANYKLELIQAFTVERDGEADRFKKFKKTDNHMLLVHGSRLTNFVGILSKGLKIAPPDVPASGYLFGKGLYFADMFSKSAHYCRATEDSSTALLLLTEVALGKMYQIQKPEYMTTPPKGYDSTKALGKWGTTMKPCKALSGIQTPSAKPVQTSNFHMQHNEYIVYDEAQVHNRYLVQVKFHFK